MSSVKKFVLYCIRWQLSTPILFGVMILFPIMGIKNELIITITANFVGSCIFYWVDKLIFKEKNDGGKKSR